MGSTNAAPMLTVSRLATRDASCGMFSSAIERCIRVRTSMVCCGPFFFWPCNPLRTGPICDGMSDEPENLTLIFLRRLDAKMDRVLEDMGDLRHRLTTLEIQVSQLASTEASHYAGTAMRLDRVEQRLDRIERRLDLVATP